MYYHHESLLEHERQEAAEQRVIDEMEGRPSFLVHTADWTQAAENKEELKQLKDDAILCGLDYCIEILPF